LSQKADGSNTGDEGRVATPARSWCGPGGPHPPARHRAGVAHAPRGALRLPPVV